MKKIVLLTTILILSGCHQFNNEIYDNYGNRVQQKCTMYNFILFHTMDCKEEVLDRPYY